MASQSSTRKAQEQLHAEEQLKELDRQMDELKEAKDELKEQIRFVRTSMLDINKLSFEAMKHLTTLSAGSILLQVAFLEKLFVNRRAWAAFVGIAMVLFIVSIVAAMYAMLQSSMVVTKFVVNENDAYRNLKKVATEFLAFLAFILGVISLAVFVLKNFYG
jgi:small-conductance mechanosensitive channel